MIPKDGEQILLSHYFLPFEARTILNIPISYNLSKDKIIWIDNNKGVFTVKSAYYVALNMGDSSEKGESFFRTLETFYGRKYGI